MPTPVELIERAKVLLKGGKLIEAAGSLRSAVEGELGNAEALRLLGECEFRLGRGPQAIEWFERAAVAAPGDAAVWFGLGAGCAVAGRFERAAEAFGEVVRLQPENAAAIACLGKSYQSMREVDRAIAVYSRALEVNPAHHEARTDLANCYLEIGRPDLALPEYRAVLERAPGHLAALDCLCTTLNYPSGVPAGEVFAAHRAYGEAVMRLPGLPVTGPEPVASGPERRLRIGYLSGDMYDHSVAYFLKPLLRHSDRARFETVCYHAGPKLDEMTEELKSLAGLWRHVRVLNDGQLASQIRADGIDILVELSGHSMFMRLPMLRVRVAPVVATYLGYPNTTGVPTVDYRIVDGLTDRAESDGYCTEKLVRLPGCFLCYEPSAGAPEVASPPCERNGFVTFGSFNAMKKVTAEVVGLWSRVVREVAGSRLVLKGAVFSSAGVRERYLALFAEHGVDAGRVDLLERVPSKSGHLGAYGMIDIGLDPFPYNGTTTTCEAMWMGVPVVSLVGDWHAGRVGLSLLTAVGLGELAAVDAEGFVGAAAGLAADSAKLSGLRRSLRARVAGSALCDGAGFVRGLEGAYREMWAAACARG